MTRPPGKCTLPQLAQMVPSISNVETYAGIVRDKYDAAHSDHWPPGASWRTPAPGRRDASILLDSAEQRIYDIRRGKSYAGPAADAARSLLETFDRLDQLNSPDSDQYKGIPTGIRELDEHHHRPEPLRPDSAGGPSRYGKNQLRTEYRPPRGGDRQKAGGLFLAGNGPGSSWPPVCFPPRPLVGGTKLRTGELTED